MLFKLSLNNPRLRRKVIFEVLWYFDKKMPNLLVYWKKMHIFAKIFNRIWQRQQDDGHLMENMIYNELLSRGMLVDVGIVPVSEKDENQKLIRKQ